MINFLPQDEALEIHILFTIFLPLVTAGVIPNGGISDFIDLLPLDQIDSHKFFTSAVDATSTAFASFKKYMSNFDQNILPSGFNVPLHITGLTPKLIPDTEIMDKITKVATSIAKSISSGDKIF